MQFFFFAKQLIFTVCYLQICKCAQKLSSVNSVVIKWSHKLYFIMSFQSLSAFPEQQQRVFFPSLVHKWGMCKGRVLPALPLFHVWSLFQPVLVIKYAMNLENLQPWRGGKLLPGLPPVFVCVPSLPLDLPYTISQQCSGTGVLSQAGMQPFWDITKTFLLSSLCIQKHELSLFFLALIAYMVNKPLKYHLQTGGEKKACL